MISMKTVLHWMLQVILVVLLLCLQYFFLPVNTERFGCTFVVSSVSVFLNPFSNIGANFVRKLIFLFRLVVL